MTLNIKIWIQEFPYLFEEEDICFFVSLSMVYVVIRYKRKKAIKKGFLLYELIESAFRSLMQWRILTN